MDWRNRIVEQRSIPVAELKAHPLNWRRHPKRQREALAGALTEVGIVQGVIWNQRTGRLVDGHLRLELAVEKGETDLPVTVVDLTEDEERLVLATLDPIGALAVSDMGKIGELISGLETSDETLRGLLDEMQPTESFWGIGAKDAKQRGDIAVSLRLLCSQVETVERAIEEAMIRGGSNRGEALVLICEAFLASSA